MTTETAIVQLKNRAEIAQQQGKRDAKELTQICNAIIDHYNSTEQLAVENANLLALAQVLMEYIGVDPSDIEELKKVDAGFFRKHLQERLPEWWQLPHWLFHRLVVDWQIYCDLKEQLREYKEWILPMLNKLSKGEVDEWEKNNFDKNTTQDFLYTQILAESERQISEMELMLIDY